MSMNEFRRLGTKIDQHMQRLPATEFSGVPACTPYLPTKAKPAWELKA